MKAFLFLCLAVVGCSGLPWKNQDEEDLAIIMSILSKPRLTQAIANKDSAFRLKAFSWKNCAASSDPLQITDFFLGPDPVVLPGNLTVSDTGSLGVDLNPPLELDLTIKKKIAGTFVNIPCVDNVGSCNYPDFCSILDQIQCPEGIPCHCPFPSGSFSLPKTSIFVGLNFPVPSWLATGDYEVKAIPKMNGKEVGCMDVQVSLKINQ